MVILRILFKYEWDLVKSPAGAYQWVAKDVKESDMIVDAHDPSKKAQADDDYSRPCSED